MADEEQETAAVDESTAETGQEPTQDAQEDQTGTEGTPSDQKPVEDESELPEWARERLTKANREAASYRTQLREAQESLSRAKTPEDYQALQDKLETVQHDLLVASIAHELGIPDDFASRLRGATEEEIRADAESIKDLFAQKPAGHTPQTPRGGLDPREAEDGDDFNPKSWWQHQRRGL